jgi:hypothetical protein
MALRIEEHAVIPRPRGEVFATAADPFRQLEWDPVTLRRVEQLSDGPLAVGARYRGTFRGFGVLDYEFVEYEPDRRFAHLARLPMGELRHTFEFGDGPDGTTLTQVGELRPNLMGTVASPLMGRILRRRFQVIAAEIDRYLRRSVDGPA